GERSATKAQHSRHHTLRIRAWGELPRSSRVAIAGHDPVRRRCDPISDRCPMFPGRGLRPAALGPRASREPGESRARRGGVDLARASGREGSMTRPHRISVTVALALASLVGAQAEGAETWMTAQDAGQVKVIQGAGAVIDTISFPFGSSPHFVRFSTTGN